MFNSIKNKIKRIFRRNLDSKSEVITAEHDWIMTLFISTVAVSIALIFSVYLYVQIYAEDVALADPEDAEQVYLIDTDVLTSTLEHYEEHSEQLDTLIDTPLTAPSMR